MSCGEEEKDGEKKILYTKAEKYYKEFNEKMNPIIAKDGAPTEPWYAAAKRESDEVKSALVQLAIDNMSDEEKAEFKQ